MRKQKGFTLIELLVVIAVIALLLSVLLPALGRAKQLALRVVCASNIRLQCEGTLLYAHDNDTYVPTSNAGYWLWDMSFWSTNAISPHGGFDDNEIFFCPANKMKKADDARFWQYSWLLPGPYTQPVVLRNEDTLRADQQRTYYRVLPYVYNFDKYDSAGVSQFENMNLENGRPLWKFTIRKLSQVPSTGSKWMIMDAVISDQNNWNFFNITTGGIVDLSGGTLVDNSNHKSRQTIHDGTNEGPAPDGANMGYADGHVSWKRFDDMSHQITWGQWFWW